MKISVKLPKDGMDLRDFLMDVENDLILQALDRVGHNRQKAAKLLGCKRSTLLDKIKRRRLAKINSPAREL